MSHIKRKDNQVLAQHVKFAKRGLAALPLENWRLKPLASAL